MSDDVVRGGVRDPKVLWCEHENCKAPADYRLHISLANRQIVWLLRCSNHLGKACLPQGCTVGEMRSVEYQPRVQLDVFHEVEVQWGPAVLPDEIRDAISRLQDAMFLRHMHDRIPAARAELERVILERLK